MGILLLGAPGFPVNSKRSTINMNFANGFESPFIDLMKASEQFGGAGQAAWLSGATWMQQIDSEGWPAYSTATLARQAGLGGVKFPGSLKYTGTFTIDGFGTGTIQFAITGPTGGSFSFSSGTGVTSGGAGIFNVVDQGVGVRWSAVFTYTGPNVLCGVNATSIDPANTGLFIRRVRIYKTADAADLALGKVYSTPWKQTLVDLCPSAIRVMNWTNSFTRRFENRNTPDQASWIDGTNWTRSPKYGTTTGTNSLVLTGVTGTPASMQDGEIAICRILNTIVRGGTQSVTGFTHVNPVVVTTAAPHGFSNGDKIIHKVVTNQTVGAIPGLDRVPFTIGSVTSTTYTLTGIDGTNFDVMSASMSGTSNGSTSITVASTAGLCYGMTVSGTGVAGGTTIVGLTSTVVTTNQITTAGTNTYTFGGLTIEANQYIDLQVGSGSDRVAYPVVNDEWDTPISRYGNVIVANEYRVFYFDKDMALTKNSSGVYQQGVWCTRTNNNSTGHTGGVPLEICTAMINELMAMSPAHPIDLYICTPQWSMMSNSQDYSAGSNFNIQQVNVILNGANGYAGLDSRCKLYVEYSNETWNGSLIRYPTVLGNIRQPRTGYGDYATMTSIKSVVMAEDIRTYTGGSPRVKTVLAGQGTYGYSGHNKARITGAAVDGSFYFTDPWVAGYGLGTPMSHLDCFAFAAYIDINGSSWEASNLSGLVTSWIGNIGNSAAQTANYATYVNNLVSGSTVDENINRYVTNILPNLTSNIGVGKLIIMYEGGWGRQSVAYSGDPLLTPGDLSGTTTISNLPSGNVSAMTVGDFVFGEGIPNMTKIVTKPTSTSITISNAASITRTTAGLWFMTPTNAFMQYCKRSPEWGTALTNFFDAFNGYSNAFLPADYVENDLWFGHAYPDFYGTTTTYGAGLDTAFIQAGNRNRALAP